MYAYAIDSKGFIVESYLIGGDVTVPLTAITKQLPQPLPFVKPNWNGEEWVEGETEEEKTEREEKQLLESLKPSPKEIADAELEIMFLTLLADVGVIQ
ncbi:hypothetical protein [Lysinibacillus fusiformis]|uniref:Uncharacterized protein n=1 Tax=Lysinibacillus fusiformis TaxID=28031 RepID=A0A1E4R4T4_9BACI|nr:hypothetical protein [Lysinibacillus fusiformis]ODV55475.1 hypothetical protein BG258_05950 [Lysinibacillus fusiformis]